MNKIFVWSLIVSLAGFLFGFDTVVISGADQALQSIWESSDLFHGSVVMATALWGTVLGAILGSFPTKIKGRKWTLQFIGFLFLISALGSALANDPFLFAFSRFIGGLGIGISTIAAPAYITEISPSENRGKNVALYQFNIVFGILMALCSNYVLKDIGEDSWRWMLGVEAVPAALFLILLIKAPKSPRWLLMKGKVNEAKEVANDLRIEDLDFNFTATDQISSDSIYSKSYRRQLLLVFFIAFFNQFSGINALLYYAPRIFEEAGFASSAALLGGVGIGVVNLVFTLLGMYLIDRSGRKCLLIIGSIGYILSLTIVSLAFYFNWDPVLIFVFLMAFIASHAIGQGAVIWVFMAEIFPTQLRASGQAFGSSVHWVLAALIPSFIPFLFTEIGPSLVFAIFSLMMVAQLVWVLLKVPETKGKKLEEIQLD